MCVHLELVYGLDDRGKTIERWAIRQGGNVLRKTPNDEGMYFFEYEPMPSSRDDEFYKEFRWDTKEDAYDFWERNRHRIVVRG